MSSVEFEEDKFSYARPQQTGIPNFAAPAMNVPSSGSSKMTQWLMKHGIKSDGAAQAILVAIVVLNLVITFVVLTVFVL